MVYDRSLPKRNVEFGCPGIGDLMSVERGLVAFTQADKKVTRCQDVLYDFCERDAMYSQAEEEILPLLIPALRRVILRGQFGYRVLAAEDWPSEATFQSNFAIFSEYLYSLVIGSFDSRKLVLAPRPESDPLPTACHASLVRF